MKLSRYYRAIETRYRGARCINHASRAKQNLRSQAHRTRARRVNVPIWALSGLEESRRTWGTSSLSSRLNRRTIALNVIPYATLFRTTLFFIVQAVVLIIHLNTSVYWLFRCPIISYSQFLKLQNIAERLHDDVTLARRKNFIAKIIIEFCNRKTWTFRLNLLSFRFQCAIYILRKLINFIIETEDYLKNYSITRLLKQLFKENY